MGDLSNFPLGEVWCQMVHQISLDNCSFVFSSFLGRKPTYRHTGSVRGHFIGSSLLPVYLSNRSLPVIFHIQADWLYWITWPTKPNIIGWTTKGVTWLWLATGYNKSVIILFEVPEEGGKTSETRCTYTEADTTGPFRPFIILHTVLSYAFMRLLYQERLINCSCDIASRECNTAFSCILWKYT